MEHIRAHEAFLQAADDFAASVRGSMEHLRERIAEHCRQEHNPDMRVPASVEARQQAREDFICGLADTYSHDVGRMQISRSTIAIIEIHRDDEERMLLAWGIHDPNMFLYHVRCAEYGDSFSEVRHEAWHFFPKAPGGGRYEPVQGPPNATVCFAYCDRRQELRHAVAGVVNGAMARARNGEEVFALDVADRIIAAVRQADEEP